MSEFISSHTSATWGRSNLQLKNVLCFLAGARVVWYSGNYEIMYSLIAPICCAVLLIAFCCCSCFVFGNGGRRNQLAEDKCCRRTGWYDCNFSAGARMTIIVTWFRNILGVLTTQNAVLKHWEQQRHKWWRYLFTCVNLQAFTGIQSEENLS